MNRNFLLILMFLYLAASLSAFGAKEKDGGKAPIVQVTGVVRLVGNANFPELQIVNSQGAWFIARDEMDKLYDLQYRTVTVEGEETVMELKFGNGMSAGTRRDLKNIKIISIE